MNKNKVLKHIGGNDWDRRETKLVLAEMLDISNNAIYGWGMLVPFKKAKKVHDTLRTEEAMLLYGREDIPEFDINNYI